MRLVLKISNFKYLSLFIVILLLAVLFNNCSDDTDEPDNNAQTKYTYDSIPAIERNLIELDSIHPAIPGEFKFAVIADSHKSFDNLLDAINIINQDEEILFVLHAGDLTVFGDTSALRRTRNVLSDLNCPYFPVPGNHECPSSLDNYLEIFGSTKYSFVFEDNKFLFIDDNFNNINNSDSVFNWIENELEYYSDFTNIFITSHIAPGDNAFSDEEELNYMNLMADYNIDLSIHGHWHSYSLYEQANCDTKYLICGPILSGRTFCVIEVDDESFEIEKIDF